VVEPILEKVKLTGTFFIPGLVALYVRKRRFFLFVRFFLFGWSPFKQLNHRLDKGVRIRTLRGGKAYAFTHKGIPNVYQCFHVFQK
jgi:hypothetical protein